MKPDCKICGSPMSHACNAKVLGKYDAVYNYCKNCGFLCAENPHWLEEAYTCAIASTDTGLVNRNINTANKLAFILYFLFGDRGNGRYVDVAGGYGMLTRLMRDYGFDFYWSDKYCENLLAHGFNYAEEMGTCRAVTAFEVLEHTEDPIDFIQSALKFGQTDTFIFTTELYEGAPPNPETWTYYSFEEGQHISFFQRRTLIILAEKMGLNFFSNGWMHIISSHKINETLLNLSIGRLCFWGNRRIRRKLQGRTVADSDMLTQKLKQNLLDLSH